MPKKIIPVLQRLDSQGHVIKIIIPDLKRKFAGNIPLESVKDKIEEFLTENDLDITFTDKKAWDIKEIDGTSYKWAKIELEQKEKLTCKKVLPTAASYVARGTFIVTVGLAEYFSYFFSRINQIPRQVAIAAVCTDVLANLVEFEISNTSENF